MYEDAYVARVKHYKRIAARMDGIMRSWKKTGNKQAVSHLER